MEIMDVAAAYSVATTVVHQSLFFFSSSAAVAVALTSLIQDVAVVATMAVKEITDVAVIAVVAANHNKASHACKWGRTYPALRNFLQTLTHILFWSHINLNKLMYYMD